MKTKECPRCGSALIEDAWESLEETEDGGVILDGFPAYVCRGKCGYVKRIEDIPAVIARQGDDRLLLLYPNEQGRILDIGESIIWPPMHYQSILGRGYWEDYMGNHDVEMLLENARDSRAAFKDVPNIFDYATSELSQDAFLCWLMAWSESPYRSLDCSLYEAANQFLAAIFNLHGLTAPVIDSIEIKRQFKSLDILTIVNDTYAILIEDKTFSKNHSDQLNRYRKSVESEYPHLIQLPIYYKIADQSHYRSIDQAGYKPFKRTMMLKILQEGKENGVQNPLFLDYLNHLQKIEDSVASFKTKALAEWDHYAWQGFYQELQKEINGDWGYVSNPAGGFWAFWWASAANKPYFLQLEQQRLCVKISPEEGEDKRSVRKEAMKAILLESDKHGLNLHKPARTRVGKVMTIAQRLDYIQLNSDGTVDSKRTIDLLKRY
ncbi:MAG: PD-(D/E)XK nuclease family protein [Bacillota bacterium]|nr:PD-(D/E)XK nuclease family protein [Cytobacillus firmus]MEC1894865.1 PD-(D/E)XK nuclease family protein [Cytobacillus firmus]MED4448256.1 PD-(D/E)XK nuclease family protein [Cytobacillus firmus]MED4768559.1 PD-(D/E)XK nuclease family protein [Cytobacillus firmus]